MRMKNYFRLAAAVLLLGTVACDELVDVETPNLIEASSIDPLADQNTFGRSALQNLYSALPNLYVVKAWQTNEARVGDTFPTRNVFGRRIVADDNGNLNSDAWTPLSRAIATSYNVIDLLKGVPGEDANMNVVRANFAAGYALVLMAESFCQGVIRVGAPMTPTQTLDSAIVRFQRAIAVATANGTPEAVSMANAARVGLARAYLNQGKKADAITAAASVPAGFVFNAIYSDDASNRGRLGNGIFGFSAGGGRESLVVGPEWRAIADAGDTRISYIDAGRLAQDGELRFYSQRKFPAYNSPIRLASKLEADYIAAEAGTMAQQLALINARRPASQGPFASTDPAAVLAELMRQKSIDFWLEGQRMGDWLRNGNAVPFILQPGNNYYKPQLGEVGDQTCWPVPRAEKDNNENFPKGG